MPDSSEVAHRMEILIIVYVSLQNFQRKLMRFEIRFELEVEIRFAYRKIELLRLFWKHKRKTEYLFFLSYVNYP